MCIQNISISEKLDYLNFLNDCEPDRLYPALRFGEDKDFMWIDGLDSKKASISKVGFQVIINGQTYTNQEDARRELLTLVNQINSSKITGAETVVYVSDVSHLPTAINGDINLVPLYTYISTTEVDLKGARLAGGSSSAALGFSSENCGYYSTGLDPQKGLVKADSTFIMRYLKLDGLGVGKAFDIDCTGNTGGNAAFDWTGVNIVNFPNGGTIKNFDNFVFRVGVLSNSKDLVFDGDFQSCVFETSPLSADGQAGNIISFPSTVNSSRRIRFENCPIALSGATKGIYGDPNMTIGAEAFIFRLCPFVGGAMADRLPGIDHLDNKSLIVDCSGVVNSANICFYSMIDNATPTTFTAKETPTKILGVTTGNANNQKFDTSVSNRAVYEGGIPRFFTVEAKASVTSSSANDQIGFYVAVNGVVISESEVYQNTNNNNRAENVSVQSPPTQLNNGDYVEIFCENDSDSSPVTITALNVLIRQA